MNYYLHRFLYKSGFFKKVNCRLSKKINGRKFIIPVIDEAGYHNLLPTESWLSVLLEKFLPVKKGAFIDVGMNIGQTLLKVAAADPDIAYYGFEPNPLCYYSCLRLVEENRLKTFQVFPVGLSDQENLLSLYLNKPYASGATVLKDFRKNMENFTLRMNVPVWRGDSLTALQEIRELAILKADVEGAELEVIQGLTGLIRRTHPIILLEILPIYDAETENGRYRKNRQDELIALLRSLAYEMFLIKEASATLEPVSEIEVHGDLTKTNYCFINQAEMMLSSR
jgi:FkbM family methyltransferase